MSLSSWRDNGWLVEHKTTADEIRALFAVAERDLTDSAVPGSVRTLNSGWRTTLRFR